MVDPRVSSWVQVRRFALFYVILNQLVKMKHCLQ